MLEKLDPAYWIKKRYSLTGWKAEVVDVLVAFAIAALVYYGIAPLILGANPPAVIVQSCSMKGVLNVGDVVVLKGVSFDEVNAPIVHLNSTNVTFKIIPSSRHEQTRVLFFPDGSPNKVNVTKSGDIIVYISPISGRQIIHRVIAKVITSDGKKYYITKGDANPIPDQAKIDCDEWVVNGNYLRCIKLSDNVTDTCTLADKNWPGCISSPVPEGAVIGKDIFVIPLVGHVKLAVWHLLTLGHGYPDKITC